MTLVFKNISHHYDKVPALRDINFTANAGEILCLLGPSGCGKTTLLNLATGILRLQAGEISWDGKSLASVDNCPPPEKRPMGLVFQDGALFPHMSVAKNIAFGLSDHANPMARVSELLEKVGLAGFENRYPHTLSGGQQQRVAVARALAPNPPILLMDEPFANIDIAMRRRLREDIRAVLRAQNTAVVIVTHDPDEAMEISDKIVVMDQGVIVQTGTPEDIYNRPVSRAVAELTSDGELIEARIEADNLVTDWGVWPHTCLAETGKNLEVLNLFIRPFTMELSRAVAPDAGFKISDVRRSGLSQIIVISSPTGAMLRLQAAPTPLWTAGDYVSLKPKTGHVISF